MRMPSIVALPPPPSPNGKEVLVPPTRAAWRAWLESQPERAEGIWVVFRKPTSSLEGPVYDELVEEALCFGWIDSTAAKFDDDRGKQFYSPRKARSFWAATNKARVARLTAEGRMTPAGSAVIEQAKANGIWELSDTVERLDVPADLAAALDALPGASANFAAFPPTARKQMLWWVVQAQRPATREARVTAVAEAAAENRRARG